MWLGRLGDRISVKVKYSASVQTGPETHPDSCTINIASFSGEGVKLSGRCAENPLLPAPRLRKILSCITASTLCPCISMSQLTLPTYLLTPWCRDLLEKRTGLQLVKKFPGFHGTRRFITALTSVRHTSLSWASPI